MLQTLLGYEKSLGVEARWLVIDGDPDFFRVTKRLHNALHGEVGDGSPLSEEEHAIYERTLSRNAAELSKIISPGDVVILHDPQTAGLVSHLRDIGATAIWRCHIGSDDSSSESDLGWSFLEPYLQRAQSFVFSRFSYIPSFCDPARTVIVAPSIDPFSPKNQQLGESAVRSILAHTGLVAGPVDATGPTIQLSGGSSVQMSQRADVMRVGSPPSQDTPLIVQVSRWDHLKDPQGVLEGFCRAAQEPGFEKPHLVLAGPDVRAVTDDPEGLQVYEQVVEYWRGLPLELRERVHLVCLPMNDLRENALIVNALQRHAAVVVQKSLREGFGLTVTEAMWKARPVIASAVGGIQDQIEHGINGMLLQEPTDAQGFADMLRQLLGSPLLAEQLGRNGKTRVGKQYLGVRALLQFSDVVERVHQDNPDRHQKPAVRRVRL